MSRLFSKISVFRENIIKNTIGQQRQQQKLRVTIKSRLKSKQRVAENNLIFLQTRYHRASSLEIVSKLGHFLSNSAYLGQWAFSFGQQ